MIPNNPEKPQYKILTGETFSNLEDDVNEYIDDGWQPYMAPVFHERVHPDPHEQWFWYQAVLYVPPDPVTQLQRQAVLDQLRAHGRTGIVTP